MTNSIWEIVIIILLADAIAWAVIRIVKKSKRGGGCCGEHEAAEKSVAIKDKNKSHYPYCVDLSISGMICSNCAKRVENALNSIEGAWATVDKNTNTAHVLTKQTPDIRLLCGAVAKAGYVAEQK